MVAAVQELELRIDGLAVDARGEGLACYCKQPGNSDRRREKVIIATLAGYNSELRLCSETSYAGPSEMQIALSCDGREARSIICSLSYLSPSRTAFQIEAELQQRSNDLTQKVWTAISSVASALLAKEWEPIRALPSGGVWSQVDNAKEGDEIPVWVFSNLDEVELFVNRQKLWSAKSASSGARGVEAPL